MEREPGSYELWEDKSNLSFIGVINSSKNHDVVLGFRFMSKDPNAIKWLDGDPVMLPFSTFHSPHYNFICIAINISQAKALVEFDKIRKSP